MLYHYLYSCIKDKSMIKCLFFIKEKTTTNKRAKEQKTTRATRTTAAATTTTNFFWWRYWYYIWNSKWVFLVNHANIPFFLLNIYHKKSYIMIFSLVLIFYRMKSSHLRLLIYHQWWIPSPIYQHKIFRLDQKQVQVIQLSP